MNEKSISPKPDGADGSERNHSETFQVDISNLLRDLDTLRARIEHLENTFAVEIGANQSETSGNITLAKITSTTVSKLKKWIRNRRIDSPAPQ